MGRWGRGARARGNEEVKCRFTGAGADRVFGWHDERAEEGQLNVDKSDEGREDIWVYVPERVREMSNDREVQIGCDGRRSGNSSGSCVENDDHEGSGNR